MYQKNTHSNSEREILRFVYICIAIIVGFLALVFLLWEASKLTWMIWGCGIFNWLLEQLFVILASMVVAGLVYVFSESRMKIKDRYLNRYFLVLFILFFAGIAIPHNIASIRLRNLKQEFSRVAREYPATVVPGSADEEGHHSALDYGGALTEICEKRDALLNQMGYLCIGVWHTGEWGQETYALYLWIPCAHNLN